MIKMCYYKHKPSSSVSNASPTEHEDLFAPAPRKLDTIIDLDFVALLTGACNGIGRSHTTLCNLTRRRDVFSTYQAEASLQFTRNAIF